MAEWPCLVLPNRRRGVAMSVQGGERVLLIEDESNLRVSLSYILSAEGYEVLEAATGEEGVVMAQSYRPRLVLLDIGLPGIDGFEVAKLLGSQRAQGMRIVVLTGSDEEDDILRAFAGFADDYVVKPVRPRVLLARLRVVLGRASADAAPSRVLCLGELRIDLEAHEASFRELALSLTRTEFELLALFAAAPCRVHRRLDLIAALHGANWAVSERSIDFQIHGLRRKLECCGVRIQTIRGVGFKIGLSEQ